MEEGLDEVIDLVYKQVHKFLSSTLNDDLTEDTIDIDIQQTDRGEVEISIEVSIDAFPFVKKDLEEIVRKAIESGVKIADEFCPKYVVRPRT